MQLQLLPKSYVAAEPLSLMGCTACAKCPKTLAVAFLILGLVATPFWGLSLPWIAWQAMYCRRDIVCKNWYLLVINTLVGAVYILVLYALYKQGVLGTTTGFYLLWALAADPCMFPGNVTYAACAENYTKACEDVMVFWRCLHLGPGLL